MFIVETTMELQLCALFHPCLDVEYSPQVSVEREVDLEQEMFMDPR